MDTNLLRSWLGLPPGPWPPGERDLLGLPAAGAVDPADAERRVMERMGRLRAQQLVHPELVTEGMNRLAQALIAITSAAPEPASPPVEAAFDLMSSPTLQAAAVPAPILEAEAVLEAEPVAVEAAPAPPAVEAPRFVPAPVSVPLPEVWVGPAPADRRDAYRELAALRALRRAWDKLQSVLADPAANLTNAGDVFAFLDGVQDLQAVLAHPGLPRDYPDDLAPRAATILQQPLPLAIFRSLTMPQRVALAREWSGADAKLHARMTALRAALHRAAPPRETITADGVIAALGHNPEWLLILATLLVFLVALLRLAFS